jgi:hypothetical protein
VGGLGIIVVEQPIVAMDVQKPLGLRKLISGGQTGVDRGALEAAIELGIPHGGWCPRGRLAEDGQIPDRFQLQETDSPDYHVRTERNVLEADATLIIARRPLSGGTELTFCMAAAHGRPCLVVNLDEPVDLAMVRSWLQACQVRILNVAGPRESQSPGIASLTRKLLIQLLQPQPGRTSTNPQMGEGAA